MAVLCPFVSNRKFGLPAEIQDTCHTFPRLFSVSRQQQNAANSVNWLFLKVRIPWKAYSYLQIVFLLYPRSSKTTWLGAAKQSMELRRAPFHNTSCWEMADPLFSSPTSLWARVPAVSPLKKHTSLPGSISRSILHTLEATVTVPALSPPLQALLSLRLPSPFPSPLSRGEDEAVTAQLGSMQLLL